MSYCLLCKSIIPIKPFPLCQHCWVTLPWYHASHSLEKQKKLFVFHYEKPIKYWLSQLKFHANLYYADLLGGLLAHAVSQKNSTLPECLIPIPLHKNRLRLRGFNQALEISKGVQNFLDIPVDFLALKRTIPTLPQTELSKSKRLLNPKNAFTAKPTLPYEHVALIDDIHTTGSTVEAACLALLKAAPTLRIQIWCCAAT